MESPESSQLSAHQISDSAILDSLRIHPPTVNVVASKSGFGTQSLVNLVTQNIACHCAHQNTEQKLDSAIGLAMINCHDLSPQAVSKWLQINLTNCKAVAIYNVACQQGYERLIEWPKMNGLFYEDAEEPKLLMGVQHIMAGDLWLPRKLLSGHLQSSRNTHPLTHNVALTQRETDILRLMKHGSSNASIGKQLGMRENTVKSHLYKVYRKIGANNRVDAGNWARINID